MGMRITPDMKKEASPEAVERLRQFARSIRCVVVGDSIACSHKQKLIVLKWWKDHKHDRDQDV